MRCAVRTHRVDPTQPRGSRRDPDQWAAGYRAGRAAVPPATGGGGGGGNRSGCALLTLLTITALCLIGGFL